MARGMGRWAWVGGGVGGALLLLVVGVAAWVATADVPSYPDTPYPTLAFRDDPAAVAQGRYVVESQLHCAHCHTAWDHADPSSYRVDAPLTGGEMVTPLGTFRPGNLTPDPTFGIGRYSDPELARLLRTGVHPSGRLSPFMRLVTPPMADEDLVAVIAYLRSLPPVAHDPGASEVSVLGRVVVSAMGLAPMDAPAPAWVPPSDTPSVARGRYLAEGPSACAHCHTARDPMDGFAPTAPSLSGGDPMPSELDDAYEFAAPNLTPHPEHGRIASWSEDRFVARFVDEGRAYDASIMPWENVARLSDSDLRSIYRYLMQLAPVDRDPGPSYRAAGWSPEG